MLTYNLLPTESSEHDDMFDDAVKFIAETGKVSATNLQRHFKIGYARAARLLDELAENKIVGRVNGAKPREILIPYKSGDTQEYVVPKIEPEAVKVEFEDTLTKWNKTKYADKKSDNFEIELGVDENNQQINLNLERYGNLLIIGSQFTGAVKLLNNILATSMANYSPEELRLIVVDGIRGDIILPHQASHLLTPMIVDSERVVSALKWVIKEMETRYKTFREVGLKDINDYKIVIVINGLTEVMMFSPSEVEDNLYRIISQGRKQGVYLILSTDYSSPRTLKEIIANNPAKLVFKPTDKKIGRETGIPESADLTSPDEAILETMYEGKTKLTINKVDAKKIYEEIFE